MPDRPSLPDPTETAIWVAKVAGNILLWLALAAVLLVWAAYAVARLVR